MKKLLVYLPFLLFALVGCEKDTDQEEEWNEKEYREKNGILFDSLPTNFWDLNSEYDDYNSAYPPGLWGSGFDYVFSSNRNSNGLDFDFISFDISFYYDLENDSITHLMIYESSSGHRGTLIDYTNTEFDELGPFFWKPLIEDNIHKALTFLYSNNSTGNHDINLLFSTQDTVFAVDSLKSINTHANEQYPCVRQDMLYFCSDRSGYYNLYQAPIFDDNLFETFSLELEGPVELQTTLSSALDDKCPFVKDSILVFTSNREGGFGGFDLYYSKKTSYGWSAPVNFGENINTPFDEYRPIIVPLLESQNTLMIFSSNRPGGKGGFDLYYVGIEGKSDLGLNYWDW